MNMEFQLYNNVDLYIYIYILYIVFYDFNIFFFKKIFGRLIEIMVFVFCKLKPETENCIKQNLKLNGSVQLVYFSVRFRFGFSINSFSYVFSHP